MDENLSPLAAITVDLNSDNIKEILDRLIPELKGKGYQRIKLVFHGDPAVTARHINLDPDLFNRILVTQGLPGDAVLGMMLSKGSLSHSHIKNRINF